MVELMQAEVTEETEKTTDCDMKEIISASEKEAEAVALPKVPCQEATPPNLWRWTRSDLRNEKRETSQSWGSNGWRGGGAECFGDSKSKK